MAYKHCGNHRLALTISIPAGSMLNYNAEGGGIGPHSRKNGPFIKRSSSSLLDTPSVMEAHHGSTRYSLTGARFGPFCYRPTARLAEWRREISVYLYVYYSHTSTAAHGRYP